MVQVVQAMRETIGGRTNGMNKRKTVAVFFGGCSAEYTVSLQSAGAVIRSIDKDRYQLVGIDTGMHRLGERSENLEKICRYGNLGI